MERTIDLSVLWNRLWGYRRPIAIFVVAATLLTATVVYLMPSWYMATATLLPPTEEETGLSLARMMRGVAVPGVRLPSQVSPADVFIAVLGSRTIREEIVTRFDLKKVYKQKFMQDAIKELAGHSKFKLTDAGTVAMQFEDTSPKRASDILQAYIELLDRFNREVRTTKGRRTRMFVEDRLNDTKTQLAKAEQALADYQAKNKAMMITPELSTAAENAARVFAQRTALQVRLGVVRGYSREGSQEEQQIQDQLAQLDQQLRSLPEMGLELGRLLRDVKQYEQVYALLTAQYEEARIDEARDLVTVDVLDPPAPPERKSRPHRLLITLVGFLLSLGTGLAFALFHEEKQLRSASVEAAR